MEILLILDNERSGNASLHIISNEKPSRKKDIVSSIMELRKIDDKLDPYTFVFTILINHI